jgi:hypothetical protein
MVEIEKKIKMKDGYPKLTFFKVWIHFFKSDKNQGLQIKFYLLVFNFLNKLCSFSIFWNV